MHECWLCLNVCYWKPVNQVLKWTKTNNVVVLWKRRKLQNQINELNERMNKQTNWRYENKNQWSWFECFVVFELYSVCCSEWASEWMSEWHTNKQTDKHFDWLMDKLSSIFANAYETNRFACKRFSGACT